MRHARTLLTTLAAFFPLLGSSFAADADARMRCSYDGGPTHLVTVRASNDALGEIARKGDEIVVREFLERPTACSGGAPTVFNTDLIRVLVRSDSSADIRLGGGPFAPGATPEPQGASEIEVEFSGPFILPSVVGTRRADEFRWGPGGAHAGLNLNPRSAGDEDIDVTVRGQLSTLVAEGGPGDDAVVPAPGEVFPNDGVFSQGGGGDDRLVAPRNTSGILAGGSGNDVLIGGRLFDLLSGDAGRDRLRGAGGADEISGGRGRDLLVGGPGRDSISSSDGSRDTDRCGSGRDRASVDPRDLLRGCELIRGR
jgi:Ca2+-binding RTX toxin-like protein